MSLSIILALAIGGHYLISKIHSISDKLFETQTLLQEQQRINEYEFEQIRSNIAQSETRFRDSVDDLEEFIAKNSPDYQVILDRLDSLDLEPTIVTHTEGQVEGNKVVVYVDSLDEIPQSVIFRTRQGLPVAWYEITDTMDGIEFTQGTYDLGIQINSIVSLDETLSPHVVTEANIFSSLDKNELFPIEITHSQTEFTRIDPMAFNWLDPHLDLGALFAYDINESVLEPAASIGFTLMSYGNSSTEILRILRISGNIGDGQFFPSISPIGYNIGNNIPFLSDTWIWPEVGYQINDGSWTVGLSIGSTL